DSVHLSRLRRSKVSFHQSLDLILELDEAARAKSSHNAQDSLAFWSQDRGRCHDESFLVERIEQGNE
ncbi:hypothetical protein Tco_0342366, partial [Tanacetum coccineum]